MPRLAWPVSAISTGSLCWVGGWVRSEEEDQDLTSAGGGVCRGGHISL